MEKTYSNNKFLGVIAEFDGLLTSSTNLNEIKSNKIALHAHGTEVPSNSPFSDTDYMFLSITDNKGFGVMRVLQIVFAPSNGLAFRICYNEQGTWAYIPLTT